MDSGRNDTLEELNALIFEHNKPVVIFTAFFMLLGILGNSLVLFVYTFRMKSSTLQIFIIYLGLVDMLGCCLGVPFDMVGLFLPLVYPLNLLCKAEHFTVYFSCISSVLTLFAIAGERFNRVCRPLAMQTLPQHAKCIVIGVTVISLLIALPVWLAYQRMEMRLDNDLVSYQCWLTFPSYWEIYFLILFSMFWILLLIIVVMYFFVWKKAQQHFRQLEARRLKPTHEGTDHLPDSNSHETTHNSAQINMTIFSITALFAVSFAPHFILNLVQPTLTAQTYALTRIIHRLWVLNCSLNPVVYGIFNGEFRLEFKKLFSSDTNQKSSCMTTKNNDVEL